MSTIPCPHCDALLSPQEIAEGRCQRCQKQMPPDLVVDAVAVKGPDEIAAPRREFDPEYERARRPQTPRRNGSGVHCPECGSRSLRSGPWPWYLGTIGAMLCRAVICDDCGHEFDARKPQANLATRKRNLALAINGVGLLGIIAVIGGLVLWIWWVVIQR
jgi:DNA-directed RNA polymerase subunit M/transcription elongation factor TFIIS